MTWDLDSVTSLKLEKHSLACLNLCCILIRCWINVCSIVSCYNKYPRSASSTVSHSALKRRYHASADSFLPWFVSRRKCVKTFIMFRYLSHLVVTPEDFFLPVSKSHNVSYANALRLSSSSLLIAARRPYTLGMLVRSASILWANCFAIWSFTAYIIKSTAACNASKVGVGILIRKFYVGSTKSVTNVTIFVGCFYFFKNVRLQFVLEELKTFFGWHPLI